MPVAPASSFIQGKLSSANATESTVFVRLHGGCCPKGKYVQRRTYRTSTQYCRHSLNINTVQLADSGTAQHRVAHRWPQHQACMCCCVNAVVVQGSNNKYTITAAVLLQTKQGLQAVSQPTMKKMHLVGGRLDSLLNMGALAGLFNKEPFFQAICYEVQVPRDNGSSCTPGIPKITKATQGWFTATTRAGSRYKSQADSDAHLTRPKQQSQGIPTKVHTRGSIT